MIVHTAQIVCVCVCVRANHSITAGYEVRVPVCLFVCLADTLMQGTQLVVHLTHPLIYTAGYELIGGRLCQAV